MSSFVYITLVVAGVGIIGLVVFGMISWSRKKPLTASIFIVIGQLLGFAVMTFLLVMAAPRAKKLTESFGIAQPTLTHATIEVSDMLSRSSSIWFVALAGLIVVKTIGVSIGLYFAFRKSRKLGRILSGFLTGYLISWIVIVTLSLVM